MNMVAIEDERFASSLQHSIAATIDTFAHNRGWEIGEPDVDVAFEAPRRFAVRVRLPAELSFEQRAKLAQAAQTQPVRRALEAGFTCQERAVTVCVG
jgi:hypothetical protein